MFKKFLENCAYSLGFGFFGLLAAWWLFLVTRQNPLGDIHEEMVKLEARSFDLRWLAIGAAVGVAVGLMIGRLDRKSRQSDIRDSQ